jgi:hypothetical protein
VKIALNEIREGAYVWEFFGRRRKRGGGFAMNSLVHLFIDTCASLALLSRQPWIHEHLRQFISRIGGLLASVGEAFN